jgi:hypothetical protein
MGTVFNFTISVQVAIRFVDQLKRGEIPNLPPPCWDQFIFFERVIATTIVQEDGDPSRVVQFFYHGHTSPIATVVLERKTTGKLYTEELKTDHWRIMSVNYVCFSNLPSQRLPRLRQERVSVTNTELGFMVVTQ